MGCMYVCGVFRFLVFDQNSKGIRSKIFIMAQASESYFPSTDTNFLRLHSAMSVLEPCCKEQSVS